MIAGSPASAPSPKSGISIAPHTRRPRSSEREPRESYGSTPYRRDVDYEKLARALGPTALRLWITLINLRDKRARVWCGYSWMMEHLGIGRKELRLALHRLDEAGLVRAIGSRHTKMTRRLGYRPNTLRHVAGALSPDAGVAAVPARALMWILRAPGWGGRRAGAGRRTGSKTGDGQGGEIKIPPLPAVQEIKTPLDPSPTEKEEKNPVLKNRVARPGTGAPEVIVKELLGGLVQRDANGSLGFRSSRPGPARPDPLTLIQHGWVPGYPGASKLGASCTVPEPPLLDPSLDEPQLANAVALVYRGAIESRYGGRCWMYGRGVTSKSKGYRQLVEAGLALLDRAVPPAAWAAWMVDAWRSKAPRSQPPVQFVFSARVIHEKYGWFRRESAGYMGGKVVTPRAHLDLVRRWNSMIEELRHLDSSSASWVEAEVRAVVARWFPSNLYAEMVEQARVETREEQRKLRAAAERGDFLW
jgi:hypothetical protein